MTATPPGPRGIEQLRLMRRLLTEPAPALTALRTKFGPVVRIGRAPMRMAVIGGQAELLEVFAMPVERFRWGHKFNLLGFVVGDESMIVSDGDEHARRRHAVQAAFSRKRLNGWIPAIVGDTDALIDRLDMSSSTIDFGPIGQRLVLGIVVRALFGERLLERTDEIGELFARAQAYLESSFVRQLPHRLPYTRRARVRRDRAGLDALLDGEIDAIRQRPSGDPADVLEALVLDGTLSDDEIRDQMVTLVGAGFDTTSASLAWMLLRATADHDLWRRLGEEADRAFSAGPADFQTLAALDLASRVMRETLRLHPAGVAAPRMADVDVTVGGRRIKRGTLLFLSSYLVGRDPTVWPDPLRFDPERWVGITAGQASLADASWIPFGRGQRSCVGFALAQMELTLILARFAQRLELRPLSEVVPEPHGLIVNRPKGGAPMSVRVRQPV